MLFLPTPLCSNPGSTNVFPNVIVHLHCQFPNTLANPILREKYLYVIADDSVHRFVVDTLTWSWQDAPRNSEHIEVLDDNRFLLLEGRV